MAFGPGRLGIFKIDNGAGTLTDISAYLFKVEAPFTVTLDDTTTFGATAETELPTIRNGDKLKFTGYLDPVPHVQLGTIYNNGGGLTGTNLSLSVEYGPMGSATGNPKFTFECFLNSYKTTVEVKQVPGFEGEVTVTAGATSTVY
jgi:hypothetical protein